MRLLRWVLDISCIAACVLLLSANSSHAQQRTPQPSECLAVAQSIPHVKFVSLTNVAAERGEVEITYAGHATYFIETPEHVVIATDFSGAYTAGKVPTIATMNRAHVTHFTLRPDPRIAHVLHGWGDNGTPAHHYLTVGDVTVRNVTTDIRSGFGFGSDAVMQKDGNSIFIFEVAGLCIGHLGHLHHLLDDSHYAAIGRLDIVMVPIDGGLTMSLNGMSEITRRLRSSVVLPMHRFSTPLDDFVSRMKGEYEMDIRTARSFRISRETLPKNPTVIILEGV